MIFNMERQQSLKKHVFHFCNLSLNHDDYKDIISKVWRCSPLESIAYQFISRFNETRKALIECNKTYFGKIQKTINELEHMLESK